MSVLVGPSWQLWVESGLKPPIAFNGWKNAHRLNRTPARSRCLDRVARVDEHARRKAFREWRQLRLWPVRGHVADTRPIVEPRATHEELRPRFVERAVQCRQHPHRPADPAL